MAIDQAAIRAHFGSLPRARPWLDVHVYYESAVAGERDRAMALHHDLPRAFEGAFVCHSTVCRPLSLQRAAEMEIGDLCCVVF
jgi:hypothetical protein